MEYQIVGGLLPSVDVTLRAGEALYTESGGMACMTGDIKMETNAQGGLGAGLRRALAGESLFMTTYSCQSGEASITFTPEAPGSMPAAVAGAARHTAAARIASAFGFGAIIVSRPVSSRWTGPRPRRPRRCRRR